MYYLLKEDDLGPFESNIETKMLMKQIHDFYINYTIIGTAPTVSPGISWDYDQSLLSRY